MAENFTLLGQGILLFLFQIGGLGIITLTTIFTILFGENLNLGSHNLSMEIFDEDSLVAIKRVIVSILTITLIVEYFGAVMLFISWKEFFIHTGERIFYAVFHSVSAFCNAGFSNIKEGLEYLPISQDYFSLSVIIVLIILGGLGYHPALKIYQKFSGVIRKKKRWTTIQLSLQTRIIVYSQSIYR